MDSILFYSKHKELFARHNCIFVIAGLVQSIGCCAKAGNTLIWQNMVYEICYLLNFLTHSDSKDKFGFAHTSHVRFTNNDCSDLHQYFYEVLCYRLCNVFYNSCSSFLLLLSMFLFVSWIVLLFCEIFGFYFYFVFSKLMLF